LHQREAFDVEPEREKLDPECVSEREKLDPECVSEREKLDQECVSEREKLDPECVSERQKLDPECVSERNAFGYIWRCSDEGMETFPKRGASFSSSSLHDI
jgi:hypothetical protein